MEKSNKYRKEELLPDDFGRHPVWTWDDDNVGNIPIFDIDSAFKEVDPLFISASFWCKTHQFKGYLIGNKTFYAFALFHENDIFMFNVNFPLHMAKKNETNLIKLLHCNPFTLFPLSYEADVKPRNHNKISGQFIETPDCIKCVPDT